MPSSRDLTRKGAFWVVSLVSSVAIFAGSMAFLLDTGRTFFAPRATAAVVHDRPVQVADVVSVPTEDVTRPAPAVTNGPPPQPAPPAVAAAAPLVAPSARVPSPSVTAVAATGVNVRAEARSGSAKVGALERGTSVAVLETRGAWTRISTETLEGWVFAKYLSAE